MRALLFALLFLFPAMAHAKPLSADISMTRIELHASFSGTDILLFGARNAPGDIMVVKLGPTSNITVREKQRIAGMWMYARKAKYDALPQFFAIAATDSLRRINAPDLIRQLQLDADSVVYNSSASANTEVHVHEAVMRVKGREHLYQTTPVPITFFGETLFKTRIHFPDSLPQGTYQVEVYLIDDGRLIAAQAMPLYAVKTGFEAWLYKLAHEQPFLYGLLCVFVALSCGWFAHRMFRRR